MKILAISPTYNEKKNISELINRISQLPLEVDLLIVDDNSPDGTADIVKDIMIKNKTKLDLLREYYPRMGEREDDPMVIR